MDADTMMPVIKSEQKADAVEKREPQKLSSKAKTMLGIYAATALILAIIVLATGLAIGGASSDVVALENRVLAQSALLSESDATLRHLSDDATITGEATDLGMVKSSSATAIDLIQLGEVTEYPERTNGFDKFCDFLSKLIGG